MAKDWRRLSLSFDPEHDRKISKLRKKLIPYAPESIGIREILLQLADGCSGMLQSVAMLHGYQVVPLGQRGATPTPLDQAPREEEEKKETKEKKKKEAGLAPLSISKEIIDYLNKAAGTSVKHKTPSHRRLIQARLNDGHTVQDFKTVIDKKCKEWLGKTMQTNLKPSCLFAACHFDDYLGQLDAVDPGQQSMFKPQKQSAHQDYKPEPGRTDGNDF
jgi:uncharacterized phage protein (TIGR02220 family)